MTSATVSHRQISNFGAGDRKLENRWWRWTQQPGPRSLDCLLHLWGRKCYHTSVSDSSWTDCAGGFPACSQNLPKTPVGSSWEADRRSHSPHFALLRSTTTVSSAVRKSDLTSESGISKAQAVALWVEFHRFSFHLAVTLQCAATQKVKWRRKLGKLHPFENVHDL